MHEDEDEDDDDEDDDDDEEEEDIEGPDEIEDVERLVEVEDFFSGDPLGSDDSFEGEDVGIVMRKTERSGGLDTKKAVTERKSGREEVD